MGGVYAGVALQSSSEALLCFAQQSLIIIAQAQFGVQSCRVGVVLNPLLIIFYGLVIHPLAAVYIAQMEISTAVPRLSAGHLF